MSRTGGRWFWVLLLQLFWVCTGSYVAFGAMELPSRLKDVPLYSGSKIVQVMDMGNNSMAMMTAKAGRDAVVDFYKQNMTAKGWKIVMQAEQEDVAVVHFSKEKETIQLAVQKGDDQGMIQYHLMRVGE